MARSTSAAVHLQLFRRRARVARRCSAVRAFTSAQVQILTHLYNSSEDVRVWRAGAQLYVLLLVHKYKY
jgi:hypothetical protein